MDEDSFAEILNLEQNFYDEGFEQGLSDGITAGRSEGRTLGLEKGFEKFCESGRLNGKSLVWANQIIASQELHSRKRGGRQDAVSLLRPESDPIVLKPVPNNRKVTKQVKALYALVESDTLSYQNTEEAVSDFDDRLKRARAKAKLIERLTDNSHTKCNRSAKNPNTRGPVEANDSKCIVYKQFN